MVMDQHLIALDLDGTTLNNQSKLTNETITTLRALARDGHIVSIITGRPYRIAKHIYDEIGIKTPMVNFNGALTHIPHEHWDKEYDVEFDTDDILKWDDDISLTEVKEPLINMENNEIIINGILESVDEDGFMVVRMKDYILTFETQGKALYNGVNIRIKVPTIEAYPYSYN